MYIIWAHISYIQYFFNTNTIFFFSNSPRVLCGLLGAYKAKSGVKIVKIRFFQLVLMNLFNTIIQCNKSFCFNWTPNVRYWNSIKVRWKVAPGYNCSLKHECPVWLGVNKHSKIHWKECFNALYEFTVFMFFFMKQIFFKIWTNILCATVAQEH